MDTINAYVRAHSTDFACVAVFGLFATSFMMMLIRDAVKARGKLQDYVKFMPWNVSDKFYLLGYVLLPWRIGAKSRLYAAGVTIWRLNNYLLFYVFYIMVTTPLSARG